ncbi:MAG: cap-binding protein [Bacillota bacterium]
MRFQEIILKWEKENMAIVNEIRNYKSTEYKSGFADGLELAILSLLAYLQDECEEEVVFDQQ